MRRGMRHGKHLGFTEPFMYRLVHVLDREMGDAYPEVRSNREMIGRTIISEEKRFETGVTDGLPRLATGIAKALQTPDHGLAGEDAVRPYHTCRRPSLV